MKTTTAFSKEIGRMFKRVRTNQGMTLAEAAGMSGSVSALSRFERGETDISVTQAQQIMKHLGLSHGDLQRILGELPAVFPSDLELAIKCQDKVVIEYYRNRYLAAHVQDANNSIQQIVQMMFKYALMQPKTGNRLSGSEEQQLAVFLRFPVFSDLHGCVQFACLPFASTELLNKVLSWWITAEPLENIRRSVEKRKLVSILSWCAFARGDEPLVARLAPWREQILSGTLADQPTYSSLQVFKNIDRPCEFARTVRIIEEFTGNAQCNWMRQRLNDAKAKLTILHNSLITEPEYHSEWGQSLSGINSLQVRSGVSGAVVGAVRQAFQLSLADLAVNWTPATQLRFEQGKLNLRFCNYLELMTRLVVFDNRVTIIVSGSDITPVFSALSSVARYYQQYPVPKTALPVSRGDRDVIQHAIAQLRQEGTGWPRWYVDAGIAAIPLMSETYRGLAPREMTESFWPALNALKSAHQLTATELSGLALIIPNVTVADGFQIWRAIFDVRLLIPEFVFAHASYLMAIKLACFQQNDLADQMLKMLGKADVSFYDPAVGQTARVTELFLMQGLKLPAYQNQSEQMQSDLKFMGWEQNVQLYGYYTDQIAKNNAEHS
jgi:transcriptional regulator with XRE-family HTH domain